MPTWHIVGSGALGTLIAFYLSKQNQLRIHPREPQQAAELLLQVRIDQQWHQQSVMLDTGDTTIDYLLICTKAANSLRVFEQLRRRLSPSAHIVLINNGLGPHYQIKAEQQQTLWLGTTSMAAYRTHAYQSVQSAMGPLFIGTLSAQKQADFIGNWQQCGLQVEQVDDIEQQLWVKLAINCAINPLTAIHGLLNGQLLDHPELLTIAEQAVIEVCQLAQHHQLHLDPQLIWQKALEVMDRTASNRSSMLQDVSAQRTTEIDYISGFVVQECAKYGLMANTNKQLWTAIRQLAHA